METILIIITALVPVAVLLRYIYKKDKVRPEPLGMLSKGLLYGVLSAFLAIIIDDLIMMAGFDFNSMSIESVFDASIVSLFGAALPEEAAKLFMLWLLLRRNKYYDEYLDGIVYAACVGLGFAGFENVVYLFTDDNWLQLGLMRGITAVPAHFTMACAMGYFYSECHFGNKKGFTAACVFLVPVFIHWLWDTLAFSSSLLAEASSLLVFAGFLFVIYRLYKKSKQRIVAMQVKDDLRVMPPLPNDQNNQTTNLT